MAGSYASSILVALVIICACEKVACIRHALLGDDTPRYNDAESGGGGSSWKLVYKQEKVGRAWMQQAAKGLHADQEGEIKGCSPCDEVYVVRDEGETLQTISEKCHAPFILLDNPHVQDTDDISAGSVLLITSTHLPC